ncbi:MAG: hypothetical protein EOM20_06730 [Spartobacteria bacterium]|nr:hypothetical protein [Spartobacteria bacterium]
MTTLSTYRIRLALNSRTFSALTCEISGATPEIWNATPVNIEIGLFAGDDVITDVTGITSIVMQIYDNPARQGPALAEATIDAADITDITAETWAAGTDQNATFALDADDVNFALDAPDGESDELWMFFYAVIGGENIALGSTTLAVHVNGAATGATLGTTSPNWRITAGGKIQLYNPDQAKYHDVYVGGAAGQEVLIISVGEA